MNTNSFQELGRKLRILMDEIPDVSEELSAAIERDAKDAADVAVLAAKKASPHYGDGKRRGFNVISGNLEASWSWRYVSEENYSKNLLGEIYLYNSASYASFVQFGHKVHKHFVPWLYVDGMGTLSYETNHNLPMFGLVVGTKTKYVDGRDMLGPANKAFEKTFRDLVEQTMQDVLGRIGKTL